MKKNKLIKHFLKYKNSYLKLLALPIVFALYYLIYKLYIPRINAFGCFDDCFNFMGGYFLLKGKTIYSGFFYNHQPLAAVISYFVFYFSHPQSIFELVLRHRQFVLIFSLFFNLLLIFRFGIRSLFFIILYEFSKFYLFGDRFLAEGIIVYPLVYLTGLVLLKFSNSKIYKFDYLLAVVFTWFVIFSREPYIPLSLFLFFILIIEKKKPKTFFITSVSLVIISLLTVFSFDLKGYFYNLFTINYQTVLPSEIKSQLFGNPLQIIFYFFSVYFYGPLNIFKILLLEINSLFLILILKFLKDKKYLMAITIFLILCLANLRPTIPGRLFYESFHMLIWYSQLIFITVFLIFLNFKNKKTFTISLAFIIICFIQLISSPSYFAYDKTNQQEEFVTNYGYILQDGEVLKILSNNTDTLFLDGDADPIYFQSQIKSSYKYAWYTSVMPSLSIYTKERLDMFKTNPPTFYRSFGDCVDYKKNAERTLPSFVENDYQRLLRNTKPSCLYIRKDKLSQITQNQLDQIQKWNYSLTK